MNDVNQIFQIFWPFIHPMTKKIPSNLLFHYPWGVFNYECPLIIFKYYKELLSFHFFHFCIWSKNQILNLPSVPTAGKMQILSVGGSYSVITFQSLTKTLVRLNGFVVNFQMSYCHAGNEIFFWNRCLEYHNINRHSYNSFSD